MAPQAERISLEQTAHDLIVTIGPGTDNVEIGMQLADELIAIRAIRAATVTTKVDGDYRSFILI